MSLHFELVTPEKLVRSEEVYMVVVPGTEGDFGVLEGHAPFLSTIADGTVNLEPSGPLSLNYSEENILKTIGDPKKPDTEKFFLPGYEKYRATSVIHKIFWQSDLDHTRRITDSMNASALVAP